MSFRKTPKTSQVQVCSIESILVYLRKNLIGFKNWHWDSFMAWTDGVLSERVSHKSRGIPIRRIQETVRGIIAHIWGPGWSLHTAGCE